MRGRLRAYFDRPTARQVIRAQAMCGIAGYVPASFSQRTRIRRNRFIQLLGAFHHPPARTKPRFLPYRPRFLPSRTNVRGEAELLHDAARLTVVVPPGQPRGCAGGRSA